MNELQWWDEMFSYHFAIQINVVNLYQVIDSRLILKSNESKAFTSIRLSINHNGRINDSAILTKEYLEGLVSSRRRQPSDKDLLSSMVLKSRNSALRIDLEIVRLGD